jgi:DNA replication protein DnaC
MPSPIARWLLPTPGGMATHCHPARDGEIAPAHRPRNRRSPGGLPVRYVLATKLVNELVEAADERQLVKTIARYGRVDLLCVDELGYMELDRRGAEMLFQVLTEREERNSIAVASAGSL